ncbi:MAG: DUF2892 domain-containing protein [Geminicoccaceae bacterium]|nr:DUF2892 domain-containing protein [Geminicoccaceae bacterium]
MFSKANVGPLDRLLRLIAGAILIILPFVSGMAGWLATLLPVVGLVLVATGFFRFCPAYRILGISTCSIS